MQIVLNVVFILISGALLGLRSQGYVTGRDVSAAVGTRTRDNPCFAAAVQLTELRHLLAVWAGPAAGLSAQLLAACPGAVPRRFPACAGCLQAPASSGPPRPRMHAAASGSAGNKQ